LVLNPGLEEKKLEKLKKKLEGLQLVLQLPSWNFKRILLENFIPICWSFLQLRVEVFLGLEKTPPTQELEDETTKKMKFNKSSNV